MINSHQGINIAFIGLNEKAQTAFAEYLVRNKGFERRNLDDPLIKWLRTMYGYGQRRRLDVRGIRKLYDDLYNSDNSLFIEFFKRRFSTASIDTVVKDVRYLNELQELVKLGFKIVRVTNENGQTPRVADYVKTATGSTVALSMLYDKQFMKQYQVDYSINFTKLSTRGPVIDTLLDNLGYKSE